MYLRNHMSRIGWLSTIDKRRRRREKVDGKNLEKRREWFHWRTCSTLATAACAKEAANKNIENVIYNFIKRLNKISIYLKTTLGCTIGAEPSVHHHYRFRLSFANWSRRRVCVCDCQFIGHILMWQWLVASQSRIGTRQRGFFFSLFSPNFHSINFNFKPSMDYYFFIFFWNIQNWFSANSTTIFNSLKVCEE